MKKKIILAAAIALILVQVLSSFGIDKMFSFFIVNPPPEKPMKTAFFIVNPPPEAPIRTAFFIVNPPPEAPVRTAFFIVNPPPEICSRA